MNVTWLCADGWVVTGVEKIEIAEGGGRMELQRRHSTMGLHITAQLHQVQHFGYNV